MNDARTQLDRLFAVDATASVVFGVLSLLSPHGVLTFVSGGMYSHGVHETLRLYGCLRLACGWIVWHIRSVDDGRFRRSVCEALCFCYMVQALAVVRAQFTDRHTWWNWVAILLLLLLSVAYGSFRFRKGGNFIKIYELPTSGNLQ
mmetsp:Transcript_26057/g.47091  ORF Transcript_26057/g.47091 Transcript_26057/m.47091 type:complete len:146 (-) Transcript_26057:658-1095(-)